MKARYAETYLAVRANLGELRLLAQATGYRFRLLAWTGPSNSNAQSRIGQALRHSSSDAHALSVYRLDTRRGGGKSSFMD